MSQADMVFEACLDDAIERLGGDALEPPSRMPAALRRRRGVQAGDYSNVASVTLIDDDGLMRWVYQPPSRRMGGRRVRRRPVPTIDGKPIRTIAIQDLPLNQVLDSIAALDNTLTPQRGLRRWSDGVLAPLPAGRIEARRVLLMVHGTFSKSDMFFDELGATTEGKQYLLDAAQAYDEILAFDHPTLAVSPWINALDLETALSKVSGTIDVVCHSRGGLVVAWWLRLGKRDVGKVLFVGSPLVGTSLASPAALRQALEHLATAARGITAVSGVASTFVPFMTVVTGLAKSLGKVLQLGADLPVLDAAVITVPGLASQSRVGNNAEMLRLFASPWPPGPQYRAVIGNFRPLETDAGWRFWRRLTNVGDQIKHGAANLVFDGPNDLVVDTACMCGPAAGDTAGPGLPLLQQLAIEERHITEFPNSPTVHHTNYFREKKTVQAMRALF